MSGVIVKQHFIVTAVAEGCLLLTFQKTIILSFGFFLYYVNLISSLLLYKGNNKVIKLALNKIKK